MAPIVAVRKRDDATNDIKSKSHSSSRTADDNNNNNSTTTTTTTSSKPHARPTSMTSTMRSGSASKDKGPERRSDNNATVKKSEDPAVTTATRRASSSASSRTGSQGASSRPAPSGTTTKKVPATPETTSEPPPRRTTKTPPTTTTRAPPPAAAPPAPVTAAATATTAVAGAHKILPPPSQKLTKHKQAAVFTNGKKKHKTNFGSAYDAGSIPCRINHGSIKNALNWTREPDTIDFNPLLITCVEGFQETEHPFVFLARTMFRQLLALEDARDKALPVLPQLIPPLRTALMSSNEDIFLMALEATCILSDVVEDEMNTYLPKLAQQIHRKLLTKQLRVAVEETLATLERNGGKDALAIIRAKIPTYTSVH